MVEANAKWSYSAAIACETCLCFSQVFSKHVYLEAPIASVSDLLFYRVIVCLAILLVFLNKNVLKIITDVNRDEAKLLAARVIMFIMNIYAMQLVMKYLTLTEAAIINSF